MEIKTKNLRNSNSAPKISPSIISSKMVAMTILPKSNRDPIENAHLKISASHSLV